MQCLVDGCAKQESGTSVAGQASSWLAVDEVEVISSSGSEEEETGAKENRASKLLDRYAQIRHRMCLSGWSPS